jgi:septum formation protein
LENHLLGKPRDLADAERMLLTLQAREHEVVTGVSLVCLAQGREVTFTETTKVVFKALDPARVRAYFHRVNPLDKAGAYAIQEHGDLIVERIEGSYSNVVGLPVERLARELAAWPSRT